MTISVEQAKEYLRVVGNLIPPNVDDRQWLLVIATGYANGLITDINFDNEQGAIAMSILDDLWEGYEVWKADEGIDPADYPLV